MSEEQSKAKTENIFFLEKQEVIVNDFDVAGLILDIGGGGEGVIGQLKGNQEIAIDSNKGELEEAADGPLKIIMDAMSLRFLDNTFEVATSFFNLMYIKALDQRKVFEEVFRVLESKGRFLIWDIDLPQRMDSEMDVVAFYLKTILPDQEIETGYGTNWPKQKKDMSHYKKMAKDAGFIFTKQSENGDIFFLELKKP